MKEVLCTISEHELDQVTGGTTPTDSGSGLNSDAVLKALRGIEDSLKDIGKNNNSLFGGNSGLLFMTFALALSRRGELSVSNGRNGFSYSWKGSW
jgi:bacteriocin-like protein